MLAELADRRVAPVTITDEMDDIADLGRLVAIGRLLLDAPAAPRGITGAST
jgi:hypothetical protein